MIQRDYFIRIIEEFMAAVARFMEKDVGKRSDDDLRDIYRQYVGDYELLRNFSLEEAVGYARDEWAAERRMKKLEMLAELWYVEGSYKSKPLRDVLLDKSLRLFTYIDQRSHDYSVDRRRKMDKIKGMIGLGINLDDIII